MTGNILINRRSIDYTGLRFSCWLVISEAYKIGKQRAWNCLCDCGTSKIIAGHSLKKGDSKSCGCRKGDYISEKIGTHKRSKSSIYSIWISLRDRCNNSNDPSYQNYGGRGITVCERWDSSFENFLADMGERPKGAQIDRIDNNGDYCPENCRWVNAKSNSRNRRNNNVVTFNGKSMTIAEWSEVTGLPDKTLYYRISKGWSIERALTEPLNINQSRKYKEAWRVEPE